MRQPPHQVLALIAASLSYQPGFPPPPEQLAPTAYGDDDDEWEDDEDEDEEKEKEKEKDEEDEEDEDYDFDDEDPPYRGDPEYED